MTQDSQQGHDLGSEAERVIRCFDPHAHLVEGAAEHLVISPRWARLRRQHPLLASTPHAHGTPVAWQTARENLLSCRDRSIQLAIATYEHRVRITARVSLEVLMNPQFDLHRHCHGMLDRRGAEKEAIILRRESFWIRSLTPDPEGYVQFEFGNTYLVPISDAAIAAESKTLWGGEARVWARPKLFG
ncbi:MAG TPA: hypothetical protein VIY53_06550 [Acidobacteriaceae bacterium]